MEDIKTKEKKESEKKKELVDIEVMYPIEEKEKENIKLDENLKQHIKGKFLVLDEHYKLNLKILYDKIRRGKSLNNLDLFYFNNYASFTYNDLTYIFFYKLIDVELNCIYEDESKNKTFNFLICSNYEINEYCTKNNYSPYLEFENNKYGMKYLFDSVFPDKNLNKIILKQDYRNYDEYKNEEIKKSYPRNNSELEPVKLSHFFYSYFKFENCSNFEYWESEKRNYFIFFILKFKAKKDVFCFKICGPSAIGKSMTLFLISRYYKNFLYFNLKTIRDLKEKNDNIKIQNILVESCKYLRLNQNQKDAFSSLLKKNRFQSFFICLRDIIDFLKENNVLSVIIFDQFKNDSIHKNDYNKIYSSISQQKNIIVKLLICSSTNDDDIREECIKSWKSNIFTIQQYSKLNQNYYFYIDELFNKNSSTNKVGESIYDKVLNNFNYIPKYKVKFKYLEKEYKPEKLTEDLNKIKERITENLKKLYNIINKEDKSEEIIKMKMIYSLRYIYLNLNEKIEYSKIQELISICSFKYYIFQFEKDYFIINYSFPYMEEIVNDIINTHLEDFYKYNAKNEHSGSANADFFELFSGKSLKKGILELPESKKSICLRVNELVKMNEFSKNELDDPIINQIYLNLKEETVNKEDFFVKKIELSNELEGRKLLLSLKDIIHYNDDGLEYHKLQYLNQLKKEYKIKGNEKLGDMSIFINQKNQRGKKLDLAYVYGKKEEKTFIGFQMKAYNEESSHDCNFDTTKENLKKALEPMIINIKYLMGMDIKYWHYVVIILYEKKAKDKQYFKKMVEKCINNGLEYIFYEPYENIFYDRNKAKIFKFIPNQFSNLDNNIEMILPINIMDDLYINLYMSNFSDYMTKNKLNDVKYIEDGLTTLINKKRKRTKEKIQKNEIKEVLNGIIDNMLIKFHFKSIKFVGAYEFLINSLNIPIPKNNFFLLIPSTEVDIYFIIFNIEKGKDINDIYYKYDTKLKKGVIIKIDADKLSKDINKKEKFYVFIYEI